MVTRVKLALSPTEYKALVELATAELRNPPDQLRHILRQDLERRGLLPAAVAAPQPAQFAEAAHE